MNPKQYDPHLVYLHVPLKLSMVLYGMPTASTLCLSVRLEI